MVQLHDVRQYYLLAQQLHVLRVRLNAITIWEVHWTGRRVYKCGEWFCKKGNMVDRFFVALNSKSRGDSIAR
jgi:hypothetical protein